ncbi:hypothetical protein JCM15415_21000 [Methanobacterium movens]
MKIVMLGKWPKSNLSGGVAVHIKYLVNALSKIENLDLYVVSFGENSEVFYEGNAKIVLIKSHKIYYLIPFLALIKLAIEVKKINPDILHLQGGNLSPYLLYSLFFSNISSIITIHGYSSKEVLVHRKVKLNSLKFKLVSFLEDYTLRKFDIFIAVGSKLKKWIENSGKLPESKVYFIQNGVNLNIFNYKIDKKFCRKKLNISDDNYVIFHAKSFVQNNGQVYLIKAFSQTLKKIPDAKLFLAGEGPTKNGLIDYCKDLGISNNVQFLGNISHKKISQLLAACDVVVIPSVNINDLEETSGILVLEAMAMKKPVIASNIGGFRDNIINGKTGILIPDKDTDAIMDNLLLLYNNHTIYQNITENAYDFVKTHRKWSKIANETMKVYDNLYNS